MADFGPDSTQLPPQIIEKPTSVTVFGVLNCVFGGLGLICTPLGFISGLVSTERMMETTAAYRTWTLAGGIIGIGFSVWLLVLGIGLLTMKRWARRGSIVYACIKIAWFVFTCGIEILMVFLDWMALPGGRWAFFIAGICICSIGLIYPVLLLIFMQTEKVKQAFWAVGG